jgi:CelD/BcsL family acetyltransferase involved in cellulose biosynthesis
MFKEFTDTRVESGIEHVNALLDCYQSRQKSLGRSPSLNRETFTKWATELNSLNRLVLKCLYVGPNPVAGIMCFIDHETVRFYMIGFIDSVARFSPGNLLISEVLDEAIRLGLSKFDFMRGLEPYKFKWTKEVESTYRLIFARPTVKGKVAKYVLERAMKRSNRRAELLISGLNSERT